MTVYFVEVEFYVVRCHELRSGLYSLTFDYQRTKFLNKLPGKDYRGYMYHITKIFCMFLIITNN